MRLLQNGIFFLLLVFLPACMIQGGMTGYAPGMQDSCGFAIDPHTGKGLRRKRSDFPIVFYIHKSVPREAHENFISAVDHWNEDWREFLEEKGEAPFPLFAVANRKAQYSGSPAKDSYNMVFFIEEDYANYVKLSKKQAMEQQGVTTMGKNLRSYLIDTDILVNAEDNLFFYDDSYNQEIRLAQQKRKAVRLLARATPSGFFLSLKQWIKGWFNFFLKPFKDKKFSRRISSSSTKVPGNHTDFPSFMIHELGHTYGAAHPDHFDIAENRGKAASRSLAQDRRESHQTHSQEFSVMRKRLVRGTSRRNISEYDLNNLFCGYFEVFEE